MEIFMVLIIFPVTAIVKYDGNLKVINIEMEDNELDKYGGI